MKVESLVEEAEQEIHEAQCKYYKGALRNKIIAIQETEERLAELKLQYAALLKEDTSNAPLSYISNKFHLPDAM